MKDLIIGLDIGGTNLRIGAVNRAGEVVCFEKRPSEELCGTMDTQGRLTALIADYLARNELTARATALAVGFPSPVSRDKRVVYNCPNLPYCPDGGFDGKDAAAPLEAAFHLPVFVDKDTVFLLQYDLVRLGLKDKGCTIGLYYGTGIGNAIYLDGRFLTGRHGVACDLGHIPYFGSQNRCACGSRGCAETYAGGYILREIWQNDYASEPFREIFTRHARDEKIRRFVEAMAIPFATELNIFDPDQLLVGGGVVEMADFPMDTLLGFVGEFVRKPFPGTDYALLYASGGPQVGVVGAAYYAMERLAGFAALQPEEDA